MFQERIRSRTQMKMSIVSAYQDEWFRVYCIRLEKKSACIKTSLYFCKQGLVFRHQTHILGFGRTVPALGEL